MTLIGVELSAKRLELMRELLPRRCRGRGALIIVDRQRARAHAVAPEAQPHHRFAHGLSPERAVCNAAPVRMRHAALARIHSGREVLDRSHCDAVLAHIHNRDRARLWSPRSISIAVAGRGSGPYPS